MMKEVKGLIQIKNIIVVLKDFSLVFLVKSPSS